MLTFLYVTFPTLKFTVIPSPEARKNLMNLAQRMIRTFSVNISTSSGQSWTALSDSSDDTVRITTRKITEPGQPNGVILSAVSTTWLPHPHYHVFDLLRDERRRAQVWFRHNSFKSSRQILKPILKTKNDNFLYFAAWCSFQWEFLTWSGTHCQWLSSRKLHFSSSHQCKSFLLYR